MISDLLKHSKILIVDDLESNIEILTGFLEFEGYENVKFTTDPREFMKLYADFQPDLVLLDLMMPYINGFELMEQLRESASEGSFIPVLVLTADALDETKKKALANGATDFLAKPFDLVEVGLRVKNLLHIRFLNNQLRDQNAMLEGKVNIRTRELELQNVELRLAWEKAEASDQLKTEFLNNVSHEIRTPLNGIVGFSQLLAEMDLSDNEKKECFNVITESSERLVNTVNNFIDISMLTSGNMQFNLDKVKPSSVILCVFSKLKALGKRKNITFSKDIPPDSTEIQIVTDDRLLIKILYHLTENALKFTSEGSVKLGYLIENESIKFYVKDTGKGIMEKNEDSIFNIFFQEEAGTSRNFEGSGLGLSIAKKMADLLGGKMWFDSVIDEGTAFYLSFPITNEIEKNGKDKHAITTRNSTTKIMVVEDDEVNYHYLYMLLNGKNVQLLWAKDGIEAIETYDKNTNIDLILMDINLPRMNGYDATQKIKEKNNQIPVIAVTAFSESEERKNAMLNGCDEFLVKPVQKTLLFEKINKHLTFELQLSQ